MLLGAARQERSHPGVVMPPAWQFQLFLGGYASIFSPHPFVLFGKPQTGSLAVIFFQHRLWLSD